MASSLQFKYRKGATTYTRTFTILSVKGLDEPDAVELFPGRSYTTVCGDIVEQIVGFRRIVTIEFGVLNEAADRAYVFNWLANPDRWTTSSLYASTFYTLADPEGFENEWRNGSQYQRTYTVRLRENIIFTEWPAYTEPTETETLYIKTWVEITGTEASPQTLTTNTAPLDTDDTGNAYPAINLAAYAVTVILNERQDCLINRIGDVAQAGANISFTVAHSDVGNAYSDGKFYAQVTIGLQAK